MSSILLNLFDIILYMEIFAKKLSELRTEKGISQAKLSKELGISDVIICYWENNRSDPTAPNLVKLADYFDVSIDYLLGRSEY